MIYEAHQITKSFPRSKFSLNVESITLPEGTITGVVGENGNGKTTLLNIIAGELDSKGSFYFNGQPINEDTNWTEVKTHIAFIPQRIPRWYGSLIQNLKLKAALDGIPAENIDDYLDEILEFLGLMEYKHLKWTEISTGYRLRFELARMLIGKPSLLVLDEPLANLDINTQQKFLSDLRKILKDKSYPTAVVLSSQQLHEIETVANHMVFLKKGAAVFSGDIQSLESQDTYKVYEIQVPEVSKNEVLTHMKTQEFQITEAGEYIHIRIPNTLEDNHILKQLVELGVTVKYYRNITQSTKRLFNP